MDQIITPALLNGVGVVGLLVGLFWMLATGRLVTRRENNVTLDRLKSAEAGRDAALAQNSELMEMARLGQDVFNALRRGAES